MHVYKYVYIYLFIIFAVFEEVICPPPPSIANSMKTGESYKYGEMISYDCEENMRFADGVISKRILCLESGQWNETDLSCAGKVK